MWTSTGTHQCINIRSTDHAWMESGLFLTTGDVASPCTDRGIGRTTMPSWMPMGRLCDQEQGDIAL